MRCLISPEIEQRSSNWACVTADIFPAHFELRSGPHIIHCRLQKLLRSRSITVGRSFFVTVLKRSYVCLRLHCLCFSWSWHFRQSFTSCPLLILLLTSLMYSPFQNSDAVDFDEDPAEQHSLLSLCVNWNPRNGAVQYDLVILVLGLAHRPGQAVFRHISGEEHQL